MLRNIPERLRKYLLPAIGSLIGLASTGIGAYFFLYPHNTLPERPEFTLLETTYHVPAEPTNCLFCHEKSGPKPYPDDHSWDNNRACTVCHASASGSEVLKMSVSMASNIFIPHETKGLEDCLLCHDTQGPAPFDTQHPWSTAETCAVCHKPQPLKLPSPKPTTVPDSYVPVSHPTAGLEDCVLCHSRTAVKPVSEKHPWSPNGTCYVCHTANATPSPAPTPIRLTIRPISHAVAGLENCRSCHGQAAVRPFPANHAQIPDNFCQICHQLSPSPVTNRGLLPAVPVSHPLNGLPGCLSCHTGSGPASLPFDHAGRPVSMCTICHQPILRVPPVITTNGALNVSHSSAQLSGTLTSPGSTSPVGASFQWGTAAGGPYNFETTPVSLNTAGSFQANISNLSAGATYYFRAKATGSETVYGAEKSFTTLLPVVTPAVTTNDATSISSNSATLRGNLDSLGNTTAITVSFQWGTTSGGPYTNETTGSIMNATGAFQSNLVGLSPATTYYYRARATGGNTVYGGQKSFTTAPVIINPIVTTGNATSIANSSAILTGSLDSLGSNTSVVVNFQWGTTAGGPFGNETAPITMGTAGNFQSAIGGLSPGVTYFFRVKATGSSTTYSTEKSFRTPN